MYPITQTDKAEMQLEMERRILGIDPPPVQSKDQKPGDEDFFQYADRIKKRSKEKKAK